MVLLLALACSQPTPEVVVPPPPSVEVEAGVITPAAAVLPSVLHRDWEVALTELKHVAPSPERDFLLAWAAVRSDRPGSAAAWIETMGGAPDAYLHYVRGRVAFAAGRPDDALAALGAVTEASSLYREAVAWRAAVAADAGREGEAVEAWKTLIEAPDPASGNPTALVALAERAAGAERRGLLRRVWAHYPTSDEARRATELLGDDSPTWREAGWRGEAWMDLGDWRAAIEAVEPALAKVEGADEDACRVRYVHGRAWYKRSKLSRAAKAFGSAAVDCAESVGEYGPKIAYLHARTEYRRGRYKTAAALYRDLARLYPEHTYADDGLVLAGVALDRAGDLDGAEVSWREARQRFPDGDMVPEALFRLAWARYRSGDGAGAREVAEELAALPVARDPTHVPAGRYWAARFAAYPRVDDPRSLVVTGRDAAVEGWSELVAAAPWSYYAVLADARLRELAPDRVVPAAGPTRAPPAGWTWLRERWERGPVQDASALLRLGLVPEARSAWADLDDPTPAELGWWMQSRSEVGDWLDAHRELRATLKTAMPGDLGPQSVDLLRVAFPDRWLPEVREACTGYRFPAEYFHALVRVESNFDASAVSWAGARGLSQVMPATGRNVGKWMGLSVGKDDLLDPEVNLKVGARYQEFLHDKFSDSPFLSAAGYNAGEHRVEQWLGANGNLPTDEYVERIPFDETRDYVKSVVGTWQTYRWLRGEGFPDLKRYNHQARPESGS